MSAKTKIVVLRMKELIYTGIFVGLAILLVVIFLAMFRKPTSGPKDSSTTSEAQDVNPTDTHVSYIPGVYTSSLSLGNQAVDVMVIVDRNTITDIRLTTLTESVEAMYPLMAPAMESLRAQILSSQNTQNITYEEGSKYTTYVLVQGVEMALKKARTSP